MAIKFFWMYIGGLLACSFTLAILVKKFAGGFATGGKTPYISGAISSILASLAAYGATFISNNLFMVFWVFACLFLLFGIIHTSISHRKYFYADQHESARVLIGEIFYAISVLFFAIVLFSSLQYFLKGERQFLFYPMLMSGLAFFLPLLVVHTFDSAYKIPPAVYPSWFYPVNNPIDLPDESADEKLLVIGFELSKKATETKRTYFRAKAPEGMKLGELYYHFINDYNEMNSETPIQYKTKEDEAYEWRFRRKPKWYQGQRILDPKQTMRENKVQENTVIICDRTPVEQQ